VNYDGGARRKRDTDGTLTVQDKLLAYGLPLSTMNRAVTPSWSSTSLLWIAFRVAVSSLKTVEGIDKPARQDVLTDKGADYKLKETAMAGNPTCIQCKTSATSSSEVHGDKDPKAKWDRTSSIVDVAKDTTIGRLHHCHDPRNQPRLVRDGLIQAIERDKG
jgi:hypothetical protein